MKFTLWDALRRSVLLYTAPRVYVEDITVRTSLIGEMGIIKYIIQPAGLREGEIPICTVTLYDAEQTLAIKEPVDGLSGTLKVPFVRPWWPRGMDSKPGYLYTLEVPWSSDYSKINVLITFFVTKLIPNLLKRALRLFV